MSEWKQRRSWNCVTVFRGNKGYAIRLDDRTAQTPGGNDLELPTRALADRIAGEWKIQAEFVDPGLMPFTQRANAALDWIGPNRAAAVPRIADYAASDLICHRADGPDLLAERQQRSWDPIIEWAEQMFAARLQAGAGIMPIEQQQGNMFIFHSLVGAFDDFTLTAFGEIVSLSGSLLIGLAALHRRLTPEEAWELSRIDEEWQTEHWGDDEEARSAAHSRRRDFLIACEFAAMARLEPV